MSEPQGNASPQDAQGSGGSSAITRDDIATIAAEVVNKAISARNKLFEKQIGDALASQMKELKGQLSGLAEAVAQGGGSGGDKDDKKDKKNRDGDSSNEFKVLQREIASLKTENERVAALAAAEKAKSRDQALRQRLTESLSEMGIKEPVRIKHAIHHLVDGEKRVGYRDADDDAIGFNDQDGTFLDLSAGLKTWMKSEDGKHFLPPTGARGSGDGRGNSAAPQNGKPDTSAFWQGVAEKLF